MAGFDALPKKRGSVLRALPNVFPKSRGSVTAAYHARTCLGHIRKRKLEQKPGMVKLADAWDGEVALRDGERVHRAGQEEAKHPNMYHLRGMLREAWRSIGKCGSVRAGSGHSMRSREASVGKTQHALACVTIIASILHIMLQRAFAS